MDIYEFLEQEEGRKLTSYQDSAGIWTIGVGSTLYRDGRSVGPNETITEEDADYLRDWEVNNKEAAIRGLTQNVELTANQITALVSFVYNLGVGSFANSGLLKKIKVNSNDPAIRKEFLKWCKYHKNGRLRTSKGLLARRKREADLYFS